MISSTPVRALSLLVLAALTSGCVRLGTATVNLFAAAKGQRVYRDIPYGNAPGKQGLRLDLYAPSSQDPQGSAPVVMFFHGGGWSSGSKALYRFAAEPFVSRGYLAVLPDYSKYPPHRYPVFMEDGADAVAWVHQNISRFGGNPSRIFLVGHSSGAHIAALLASNRRFLKDAGVDPGIIAGVVGLAGPYKFVPEEQLYRDVFAPAGGDASSAMPATYLDGLEPPMLLLYGLDDDTVHLYNIRQMVAQAEIVGSHLECRFYEEIDHLEIVAALSLPFRRLAPVVDDATEFFERIMAGTLRTNDRTTLQDLCPLPAASRARSKNSETKKSARRQSRSAQSRDNHGISSSHRSGDRDAMPSARPSPAPLA